MAALPQEVQPFLRRIHARARRDLGLPAWEWGSEGVVVALSGMGGPAARRAGATLISRCRPELLVSLGFAGALRPGLAAGDLVLGTTFWHYDVATRQLQAGSQPVLPSPTLPHALEQAGPTVVAGSVVTTARIIRKGSLKDLLSDLPHPVLDLETGVLAELAAAQGLPFLSLRAITDTAGEEIPEFLRDAGDQDATVGVWQALKWLGRDFRRMQDLFGLWRRSRRAGQALADALIALVPLLLAAGRNLQGQPGQEGNVDKNSHPA